MPHTRRTLALTDGWDIYLNDAGHIVMKEGAEATAQAVANECRLFTNDAYFIQDRGTPFFLVSLGKKVQTTALRSYLRKAATRVEDVREILSVTIDSFDSQTRHLVGEIQFSTVEDETATVTL